MLENTFVHIPGVGATTEQSLWRQGCTTWTCLRDGIESYRCGTACREDIERTLEHSIGALEARNPRYFAKSLAGYDTWRAFPDFRDDCVYLDIETDGGQSGNSITTVGLFNGKEFTVLIKDQNLKEFPDIISQYKMIVTFFGNGFDLPMLKRKFRDVTFDQIHIDLCPTLRQLGLRGGLKKIERQLNISRGDDTDGLGGLDAIRLWRRYTLLRDEKALETLIAYNREDVVNLETLAVYAYRRLKAQVYDRCLAESA